MRRFLIPVCALVMFWACSNDSEDFLSPEKDSPLYGMSNIPKNIEMYDVNQYLKLDTIGVAGLSNKSVWLGVYDKNKKHITSFQDDYQYPDMLTSYTDNKVENFKIEKVVFDDLFIDGESAISIAKLQGPSAMRPILYNTLTLFSKSGNKINSIYSEDSATSPIGFKKWSNNTVMLYYRGKDNYRCYSYEGELIYTPYTRFSYEGHVFSLNMADATPVNIEECISYEVFLYRLNLKTKTVIWCIDDEIDSAFGDLPSGYGRTIKYSIINNKSWLCEAKYSRIGNDQDFFTRTATLDIEKGVLTLNN